MQTVMAQPYTELAPMHFPMARPILPESERWRLDAHMVVYMTLEHGDTAIWYPYMTSLHTKDILFTWFKKPAIKDAVMHSRLNGQGDVHNFHPDGSVTARWFGATYHWPAGEPESYIVQGTITEPTHFHNGVACYSNCSPHYHNMATEPCYDYCEDECSHSDGGNTAVAEELLSDDE